MIKIFVVEDDMDLNRFVSSSLRGAGCLTHGPKDKAEVDKYGREALEKTISDAVSVLK